jgi:CheY-like chemotaxis protein
MLIVVAVLVAACGWVGWRVLAFRRLQRERAEAEAAAQAAFAAEAAARKAQAAADAERRAAEQRAAAEHAEAERQAAERRAEAERQAEAQRRAEAERLAAEALRQASERAAEQERQAAEQRRQAAEQARHLAEAARLEAERLEHEERERRAGEQRAAEEAARRAAERLEAEARARREAERLAEEARAREEAERAAREEAERAAAAARPAPKRPEDTLVMVADDSKIVRVKTGRLLAQHHYQVVFAADGAEALQQFEARVPDVLITDVEMPVMDGFELTRLVRARADTRQLPVIMITAADDRHQADATAAGVSVLLGKPYPDDVLLAHIAAAMGRAGAMAAAG